MTEIKEEKEQLYICDHARECNGLPTCSHRTPHKEAIADCREIKCNFAGLMAKCIPYTEPKEEEKEPKTKRVAILAFLDIPDEPRNQPFVRIVYQTDQGASQDYKDFPVEEIDINRLEYASPKKGDMIVDDDQGLIRPATRDFKDHVMRLIIATPTPTPEPETVEEWLDRMPKAEDHKPHPGHFSGPIDYSKFWRKMMKWQSEKPEEREA